MPEPVFHAPGSDESSAVTVRRRGDNLVTFDDGDIEGVPFDLTTAVAGALGRALLPLDPNARVEIRWAIRLQLLPDWDTGGAKIHDHGGEHSARLLLEQLRSSPRIDLCELITRKVLTWPDGAEYRTPWQVIDSHQGRQG